MKSFMQWFKSLGSKTQKHNLGATQPYDVESQTDQTRVDNSPANTIPTVFNQPLKKDIKFNTPVNAYGKQVNTVNQYRDQASKIPGGKIFRKFNPTLNQQDAEMVKHIRAHLNDDNKFEKVMKLVADDVMAKRMYDTINYDPQKIPAFINNLNQMGYFNDNQQDDDFDFSIDKKADDQAWKNI
jgi:hypothetical protein